MCVIFISFSWTTSDSVSQDLAIGFFPACSSLLFNLVVCILRMQYAASDYELVLWHYQVSAAQLRQDERFAVTNSATLRSNLALVIALISPQTDGPVVRIAGLLFGFDHSDVIWKASVLPTQCWDCWDKERNFNNEMLQINLLLFMFSLRNAGKK